MTLAKAYDTEQIPYISASHAEQLEFTYEKRKYKRKFFVLFIKVEIQVQQ
jgi:hypothetical protein